MDAYQQGFVLLVAALVSSSFAAFGLLVEMSGMNDNGAELALKALANQYATMCYERWEATNRIYALKAEMARRATS